MDESTCGDSEFVLGIINTFQVYLSASIMVCSF